MNSFSEVKFRKSEETWMARKAKEALGEVTRDDNCLKILFFFLIEIKFFGTSLKKKNRRNNHKSISLFKENDKRKYRKNGF